jgi:hypothetical protein
MALYHRLENLSFYTRDLSQWNCVVLISKQKLRNLTEKCAELTNRQPVWITNEQLIKQSWVRLTTSLTAFVSMQDISDRLCSIFMKSTESWSL